jgi:hypothetical protein
VFGIQTMDQKTMEEKLAMFIDQLSDNLDKGIKIDSVLDGPSVSAGSMTFGNVIGTTNDKPIQGKTWINLYRSQNGFTAPMPNCRVNNCDCKNQMIALGGHIQNQKIIPNTMNRIYIGPICSKINNDPTRNFNSNGARLFTFLFPTKLVALKFNPNDCDFGNNVKANSDSKIHLSNVKFDEINTLDDKNNEIGPMKDDINIPENIIEWAINQIKLNYSDIKIDGNLVSSLDEKQLQTKVDEFISNDIILSNQEQDDGTAVLGQTIQPEWSMTLDPCTEAWVMLLFDVFFLFLSFLGIRLKMTKGLAQVFSGEMGTIKNGLSPLLTGWAGLGMKDKAIKVFKIISTFSNLIGIKGFLRELANQMHWWDWLICAGVIVAQIAALALTDGGAFVAELALMTLQMAYISSDVVRVTSNCFCTGMNKSTNKLFKKKQ